MNIMRSVFIFLFFLISFRIYAVDVEVEVSPPEPLVNESFFVTFHVKTTGNVEPYISFTPVGASVQGKREQGVSISTTVINGKFTTNREQNYVYELVSERAGQVSIKNIKIDIDGKISTAKDIQVNVLAQAKKAPDAFLEAIASKTKVYIGEGIDVNYYLYYKTSISAYDVKEFPKLNKFIKRFHHLNSPAEVVQYKGQVFKRILIYSARLYPEKVGPAVLDSMTSSVQIVENDYTSPFGGFGLGAQKLKNKDLSSPRIEIEVLPLPVENVPTGFTGMVGEHDFSLNVAKNKYLINEPIELKLEVKGKGALEKMDAPNIYSDNNLEQFDTKSEVTEVGTQSAKKVFEYTLLARGPLALKARELSLAYFDPASGKYIEKKISIPPLEVSGVAAASNTDGGVKEKDQTKIQNTEEIRGNNFLNNLFSGNNSSKSIEPNSIGLVGPIFSSVTPWSLHWFDLINVSLVLLIIIFLIFWYLKTKAIFTINNDNELKNLISSLKKQGLSYSELYSVVTKLDKDNSTLLKGHSIDAIIENSQLSVEAKSYFKLALQVCEEQSFGVSKNQKKINFENKHFKELLRNI